jgi:hypothetical protein
MLSPQALMKGLVSRILPQANPDGINNDVASRLWTYGETVTNPMVRKAHNLADEGSYFVTNNAQTGVAMTTTSAFSATAPFVVVQNGNPVGGRNIYLDYINLVCTVAGTAASGLTYTGAALYIDSILRYTSGGSQLTAINSPNMGAVNAKSGATIYAGAITAAAASGNVRALSGLRVARPALSGTVATVVGDTLCFNFGGVEGGSGGNISITAGVASIVPIPMPPVVIPPQSSALLYLFYAASGTPVAAQWAPEIGHWER